MKTVSTPEKNVHPGWRLDVALMFLSAALLMLEILQIITLSFQTIERNAFLVISLALLGLGAGGSLATRIQRNLKMSSHRLLWKTAFGFALSLFIFMIPASRLNNLLFLVLLGALPYLFGGIFFAFVFKFWPERANRSYFFNLVGSSLGCLGLIWVLNASGDAALTVLFIAGLALLGSAFLLRGRITSHSLLFTIFLALLLSSVPLRSQLFPFHPHPKKALGRILKNPRIESDLEWSRWGYLGRLDILKPGKGIENLGFGGGEAVERLINHGCQFRYLFASGGNWSKAIDFQGCPDFQETWVERNIHTLPHHLIEKPDVLNIGFGGGVEIFVALQNDPGSITGVEINPLMVEAIQSHLPSFFGSFYRDPRVEIRIMDGRTFVRNTDRKFDLVTVAAVDTGASVHSDAMVLSENFLYTLEAFKEYFSVLRENGFLFIVRPFHQSFRILSTGVQVLRSRGAEAPERHFAVLGPKVWKYILIGKSPLSGSQINTIREAFEESRIAYLPGWEGNDSAFNDVFKSVQRNQETEFFQTLESDFLPITDDKPYFYRYKWGIFDSRAGRLLLKILFSVLGVSMVLILLPLRKLTPGGKIPYRSLAWTFMYFGSLGAGFMFLEIALIRKMVLFLGDPSYSVSVTLFSILFFSGMGSLATQKFGFGGFRSTGFWIPLLLAVFYFGFLLDPLVQAFGTEALGPRILITICLLAPGSFFMGMPFPTMIRFLGRENGLLVPWAWAINAFTSVVGSVLATLLAMKFGFSAVIVVGGGFYLVAGVIFITVHRRSIPMRMCPESCGN